MALLTQLLTPQSTPSILNDAELQAEFWRNRAEMLEERVAELEAELDDGSIEVEATFYTAFCPTGCTGITASGLDVRSTIYTPEGYRVIAVDPSVIPLGSVVEVTLENGDSFTAKAADVGGAIKGARIDVLVSNRSRAYELGRQSASVRIINEGER